MAFTRSEFLRGALSAWLWFLTLALGAYGMLVFPFGAFYGAIVAVPVSMASVVVFAAPAWWLGRGLRCTTRIAVHVALFAGFGAVVGLITTGAYGVITTGRLPFDFFGILMFCVNTGGSALAVALGWRRGARAVLRPGAPTTPDVDAQTEDELVARSESRTRGGATRQVIDALTDAELAELAEQRSARRRSAD